MVCSDNDGYMRSGSALAAEETTAERHEHDGWLEPTGGYISHWRRRADIALEAGARRGESLVCPIAGGAVSARSNTADGASVHDHLRSSKHRLWSTEHGAPTRGARRLTICSCIDSRLLTPDSDSDAQFSNVIKPQTSSGQSIDVGFSTCCLSSRSSFSFPFP